MKRKWSLKLAPTRLQSSRQQQEPHTDGVESPPLSPMSTFIDRPGLSPRTESALRRSCAVILQELKPSGQEFEDVANEKKVREMYMPDDDVGTSLLQLQSQPTKSKGHHRIASSNSGGYVPTNAASGLRATTSRRKPSFTFEPLEPTLSKLSNPSQITRNQVDVAGESPLTAIRDDPLSHIRSQLDSRPKTSAAACIDYVGSNISNENSNSTTRSNTTHNKVLSGPSTGMTSLALTPGSEKRFSGAAKQRVSEQVLQDGEAAKLADSQAKAWMAETLARRRAEAAAAEQTKAQQARPPSRSSVVSRRPSVTNAKCNEDPIERPRSRAGSFRAGLSEYIRPGRASSDSVRPDMAGLSRSNSRSSSNNNTHGNSWWRSSALRRKGSWSSFRSAKQVDPAAGEEVTSTALKDGQPNLNRDLPALPGLDQYKEKKTHIAQLMRAGTKPKTADGQLERPNMTASIVSSDGLERTLSESDQVQREQEFRRLVQEKTRQGKISDDRDEARRTMETISKKENESRPLIKTNQARQKSSKSLSAVDDRGSRGVVVFEMGDTSKLGNAPMALPVDQRIPEKKLKFGQRISQMLGLGKREGKKRQTIVASKKDAGIMNFPGAAATSVDKRDSSILVLD